jgi:predicted aldo/keto reductase-like oxidoreductase
LDPDELARFDEARRVMRARIKADCTACRYCQPCPSSVEIPAVLASLNAATV